MNDWDDPTKPVRSALLTNWWLTKRQWADALETTLLAILGGAAAWLLYAVLIVIV